MANNNKWARILVYAVLIYAVIYYLLPLYVMITTSVKTTDEIRTGNLLSLPMHITLDAWRKAWGTACTGVQCTGLSVYFWNSVRMVFPAVIISTTMGAINGYILSKWKFYGSEIVFAMLMYGLYIPFQVLLLPMAQTEGYLALPVPHRADLRTRCLRYRLDHAVLPQLLRRYPGRADQRRTPRWRWLLAYLLPRGAADVAAYRDGDLHLAIYPDLERLPVRSGVLLR